MGVLVGESSDLDRIPGQNRNPIRDKFLASRCRSKPFIKSKLCSIVRPIWARCPRASNWPPPIFARSIPPFVVCPSSCIAEERRHRKVQSKLELPCLRRLIVAHTFAYFSPRRPVIRIIPDFGSIILLRLCVAPPLAPLACCNSQVATCNRLLTSATPHRELCSLQTCCCSSLLTTTGDCQRKILDNFDVVA